MLGGTGKCLRPRRASGRPHRPAPPGTSPQAGKSWPPPECGSFPLEVDHGHAEADQVRKQLERLVDVVEVEDLTGDEVHNRELVVAKVKTLELARLIQRGAKVISTDTDGTTVEFSGDRDEIFDFVEELARHGIVDVVRSGPLVMRRTV
ncbi:MAG: acetolactate synthase small subunit [Chloroflexi bacterium]|nr:MAG: acetolactate synthase small subunit [Chloroflexota bacterium]